MVRYIITSSRSRRKPAKPYPDFPLFAHASGRWAKKIRAKHHYFGPWEDADTALKTYLEQRDDLYAGRVPQASRDGLTVAELCNRFLTAKERQRNAGELTPRSWDEYYKTCAELVQQLGGKRLVENLVADDFERLREHFARRLGPYRLANEVQRTRTVFKYGYDAGLMDRSMRFGPVFVKPSSRTLRTHRNQRGPRMLEADEIRRILAAANVQLRAMTLLGVNAGYGNSDVATLPLAALDLAHGWVTHPRPKTGIARRCSLWEETTQALNLAISSRPSVKDPNDDGLVFLTRCGTPWIKNSDNAVTKEFRKLLDDLDLHRTGLGFYTLRHVFQTIAGESRDQVAVNHIMGHVDESMASIYRERVSDERLRDVVHTVHEWLFTKAVVR